LNSKVSIFTIRLPFQKRADNEDTGDRIIYHFPFPEHPFRLCSLSFVMNGMLAAIPAPWSGVKASYINSKIPYRGESPQLAAGSSMINQ